MARQKEEGAPAETWPGGACPSSQTSELLLLLLPLLPLPLASGWAGLLAAAAALSP